jgi:hypothetical protein
VAPSTAVHKLEFGVLAQAMIVRNRHRDAILLGTRLSRLACVLCMEDVVENGSGYSRNPAFTETRLRPLARRRDSTA